MAAGVYFDPTAGEIIRAVDTTWRQVLRSEAYAKSSWRALKAGSVFVRQAADAFSRWWAETGKRETRFSLAAKAQMKRRYSDIYDARRAQARYARDQLALVAKTRQEFLSSQPTFTGTSEVPLLAAKAGPHKLVNIPRPWRTGGRRGGRGASARGWYGGAGGLRRRWRYATRARRGRKSWRYGARYARF